MTNIPGVNVPGPIVPFTDADTYPTHDSQYGIGGWREVASTGARDAIPASRLRVGMVVFVQGDKPYVYNGTGWDALTTGGGGSGSFPDTITAVAATNLTTGQLVSLFQNAPGDIRVRPTDATLDSCVTGFVTQAYSNGQTATIKLEGVFTVVSAVPDESLVGFPLYLNQTIPGAIDTSANDSALNQRIGTLLAFDSGTNTCTVAFDGGGFTNNDVDNLIFDKLTAQKDHANGLAGLDANTRVFEVELNKNITTSTDLSASGGTESVPLNGSDIYVFTGTPATNVNISLSLPGGQSAGEFTVQNDSSKDISVQAGGAVGAIYTIPSKGSQKFYYPTGIGLVASSNIKDGKRYYQTSVDLDITADGIMPGQRVVIAGSAGSSDITVSLPVAATVPGATVLVTKVDSGIGKVLLQPGPNDFIGKGMSNGQIFNKIASQFDTLLIASDGSDWEIFSGVPFTAPAHQFLTKYNPSGDITSAQPAAADLSDGVLGTGAVVLASARGVYSLNFGSVMVPLTGTKFPNCSSINMGSGDHDLYTCPAGKKAMVIDVVFTVPAGNATSVTGLAEVKISGTYHVFDFFALGAVAGSYGGTNSLAPFLLGAGEIFAVNTDHTGMSVWPFIVEFDDTVAITDVRLLTLANGANTLFTMPSSKTVAFMNFPSAFNLMGSGRVWYYNGSLASRSVQIHVVPNAGSPSVNNAIFDGSVPTGQMAQPVIYGSLATGDFIDVTTNSNAAGQKAWIVLAEI